jgi:nucleoside-diphosphate-sugar epimerase
MNVTVQLAYDDPHLPQGHGARTVDNTIFLAGAAGAIGKRLLPLLLDAGYQVFGTTRSRARATELSAAGAIPVIVDAYDAAALTRAVVAAGPQIVINQLTDLPFGLDPLLMVEGRVRNARIRQVGSRNLICAALEARARRILAQSIAWAYAPGKLPHAESDPLDALMPSVQQLEEQTLGSLPLAGIVLRHGLLYGPGTGMDRPDDNPVIAHVDAAAQATLLAIERGATGIYNIVEHGGQVSADKARRELGWDPGFRLAMRH